MSFIKTGSNSARNETTEVKISKRDQLHYVENSGTIIVPIEIGADRVIAIATSQVSSARRQEIRQTIDEALDFLKIPHRFDS
jgi:hypothetical protein